MLKEVEELYQIKRKKYKEVSEQLDRALFMEAVKETAIINGINEESMELMKG